MTHKLFTKPKHTLGELMTAITSVQSQEEATQFREDYIAYMREYGATNDVRDDPETVVTANIGYMLGYGVPSHIREWHEAAGAVHPIFGKGVQAAERQ